MLREKFVYLPNTNVIKSSN